MRILITIPAIGSVYGGPSTTVIDLAQALYGQGITVDIVTTNANGSESLDTHLQQWLPQSGYRLQYFPYLSLGDYKWSNALTRWLIRHVRDYDLVHSNAIFSLPNISTHWICQWQNLPYLMTPHGMLEPWAMSYKGWKKRWYYALLERPALNKASTVQALASPEASNIKALHLKSPIVTISNGIHRQDFETLSAPTLFYQQFPHTLGKTIILFLGRIDPKKGLDLLASAFAQVKAQFPNTNLIIAGPDNVNFRPTAQQYFTKAQCADAVTFAGMLTGDLKRAALSAADLYVAPSYSEGFSMSVLEGMASGLPCVITTGCNFPEAAQAKAAKVVDIQADAIASALIECLADPLASKAMGDRARQLVLNNYTWDRVAAQLIEVYAAILEKKSVNGLPSQHKL